MIDVKWYLDSACIVDAETNETISTRALIDIANKMHSELSVPVNRSQTKTIADAVEWLKKVYGDKWVIPGFKGIAYNSKNGTFDICVSEDLNEHWELVCTRAEFEAYVNANKIGKILESRDEQEGEKWTHTYNGDICRIAHQIDDDVWIKFKYLLGSLVIPVERLKPIKPTISESEAFRLCLKSEVSAHYVMNRYDVVKD